MAQPQRRTKLFDPMDFFRAARRNWEERHVKIERVTVAPGKTELREVFQVRSVGLRRATAPLAQGPPDSLQRPP